MKLKGVSESKITERPHKPQKDSGLCRKDSGEPLKHFKQGHDKITCGLQKYKARKQAGLKMV